MNNPTVITLIAAMSENRVIGRDGQLPWRLPGDLKRFKALTMGHTVVMGRKTFDSIGRALPGRRNIVVTRQPDWRAEGVQVAHTLETALDAAREDRVCYVIGGEQIYRAALRSADCIELTLVHTHVEGDAHFPEIDPRDWSETTRSGPHDDPSGLAYSLIRYDRRA